MSETQATNKPLTASSVPAWDVASLFELVGKMVWRLPGCADLAIRMSLCNAWRTFCENTEAWRCRRDARLIDPANYAECGLTDFSETDAVLRYKLCVPAVCHVKNVFNVYVNGVMLPNDGRNWGVAEHGGCGKIIMIYSGVSDSAKDVISASYSIVPDDDGESVPVNMLRKYGPVIVSGALYMLFGQDNKPWSDATMARVEMENWNNGMSEASLDGITSEKSGPNDKTNGRRVSVISYGNFN